MKKNLLFLFSFLSLNTFAGAEVRSTERITAVNVFLSAAQVFSTVQAQVESGLNDVVVTNIPSDMNPNSIQVSGYGNFSILSVSTRQNYLSIEKARPEVKALKDSLEDAQDQLTEEQNRRFAFEQEEQMVLANKSIGGATNGVIIPDLEDAANFFRNRILEIRKKMATANKNISRIQTKIQQYQNQLNEMANEGNQLQTEIVITVSTNGKGLIGMEMNYLVNNAGWTPFYDIKSKGVGNPLELTYKAKVWQNTGKIWDNIHLTLSSGNPNENAIKPELGPWLLNFYYPGYNSGSLNMKAGRSAETKVYIDGMSVSSGDKKANTTASYTFVQSKELNETYDISIPYTIENGSKAALVDIQNYTIPATYRYATCPKLDQGVYLLADVLDWEKYSLVSANANVFLEGSFIGETYLNTLNPEDTLHISLGKDKGVIVQRKKVKDFSSEKFVGGNKRIALSYEINLKNNKQGAASITLEDQLPISEQSSIEVKTIDLDGAQLDPATGKLTWKIDLAPNATKTIKFSFEVKHPKDKTVPGL